jgi:hypothetical protein
VPPSERPREWREWLPQAQALVDEWAEVQVGRVLSAAQVADLVQRVARALHRAFQSGASGLIS